MCLDEDGERFANPIVGTAVLEVLEHLGKKTVAMVYDTPADALLLPHPAVTAPRPGRHPSERLEPSLSPLLGEGTRTEMPALSVRMPAFVAAVQPARLVPLVCSAGSDAAR